METFMGLFGIVIFIGVLSSLGFGIGFFVKRKELLTIEKQFKIIANTFNLDLQLSQQTFWEKGTKPIYPGLRGVFEEQFQLDIFMEVNGSGKNREKFTVFRLLCSNTRNALMTVSRENIFGRLKQYIGHQNDVSLRDAEFDHLYKVKSVDSLFVKELFADPSFREFFIKYNYAFEFGKLDLRDNMLEFRTLSSLHGDYERKRFIIAIRLAIKIAERLEEMG